MLKNLRDMLSRGLENGDREDTPQREHGLRLATATLLVEVMRADYEENLTENAVVFDQLRSFFELTAEEARLLMEDAARQADHAVSLQSFTRLLHERLTLDEKHSVVEMLWRVALADDELDKHEDHLVRKVAGLLYISHGDLIRIRNRVHMDAGAD
jgi:uncharacterized tellurite resistance protein B-like protein